MRESANAVFSQVKPGFDLVLLARQPLPKATFQQTKEALVLLLKQAQLLQVINGC
jgi:RNase P protein component